MKTTVERPADSAGALYLKTNISPEQTSRRAFLAQAAITAAGGAALGAALPLPGSAARAGQAPDPILELIQEHKVAHAQWYSAVDHRCKLERGLPAEMRRSSITCFGEEIVETDDPRWIEAERQADLTADAASDAAWALLEESPSTREGLLALLVYAVAYEADGHLWPEEWNCGLLESLAAWLPILWPEGAAV
ncbi:hypothetical protein [Bradyrhizobium neotropicale]|uniref:hypothetical protein n=1 Tax=Bradyrhizobium neotropicale TaxID=1497615 RepID=UPI001AD69071|nr:hypothetical protein [Bradyrhizobium neotropicale]MBO4226649.1 hypothetical protein [Bradyrhizobium neotropicale]